MQISIIYNMTFCFLVSSYQWSGDTCYFPVNKAHVYHRDVPYKDPMIITFTTMIA